MKNTIFFGFNPVRYKKKRQFADYVNCQSLIKNIEKNVKKLIFFTKSDTVNIKKIVLFIT